MVAQTRWGMRARRSSRDTHHDAAHIVRAGKLPWVVDMQITLHTKREEVTEDMSACVGERGIRGVGRVGRAGPCRGHIARSPGRTRKVLCTTAINVVAEPRQPGIS